MDSSYAATSRRRSNPYYSRLGLAVATALGVVSTQAPAQTPIEEVVVTGTRIQQSGMQTPVPVTTVDADELAAMAPGNLVEGVSRLPQFFANQTPTSNESWFTRGGYGNLNLRGLGINRTLTLLDGRRMISSTAFGGVDINVFPEAMIERVETVTGGASAAYGTDAVAGVANFILDTDFTGVRTHLQTGQTSRGDADNYEFSVAFGTEVGRRGHFLISAERFDQDGVHDFTDRDWYQGWGTIPDANGMLLVRPRVVSANSTFDGLIFAPGTALHGLAFKPDGSYEPFQIGDIASGALGTPPARHSVANGGSGDDLGAEVQTLMPDNERESVFAYFDFDFSDNLTVYAQAIYGSNKTHRYNAPRGSLQGTPTAITIFADNAFLPDELRAIMNDPEAPIESFTLRRMGSKEDIGRDITLWDDNEMTSLTAGFKLTLDGGAFDGWQVDGYYQRGDNERRWYQHGLRVDRIHAAVDAVQSGDDIVCRTTLFSDHFAGCKPLNLFGRGRASNEAIDWVVGNDPGEAITTPLFFAGSGYDLGIVDSYIAEAAKVNITEMEQNLFELTANGQISEGWAGPISLAVGVSYRDEEIFQIVRDSTNRASDHDDGRPVLCDSDPLAIEIGLRGVSQPDCLNTVGMQYSKVSNITGKLSVREAFAETYVPLVADRPLMQSMTLGLAARWADYSGSGDIWAWKAGLDMRIVEPFRFRVTKSRDVRAANLSERFDKTGGSFTIQDPRYPEDGAYNVTGFSGGNPTVRPEEADTVTAGFVYQPNAVDGLSISFDWYQVDIKDAIGQLGHEAVVRRCEEGAADLCSLVTRNPETDRVILVGDVFINIDEARVRGKDLEVLWRRDVSWLGGDRESFQARVFASWLDENSETLAGTRKIDRAGQTGIEQTTGIAYQLPDFKAIINLSYRTGPFDVFLQGRYIADGIMEAGLVEGVDIESNKVGSAFYTDLRFGYTRELRGGASLELFANVNNLLDTDPPVTPYYSVFLGQAQQTNPGLFDLLGRMYTAGVRFSF